MVSITFCIEIFASIAHQGLLNFLRSLRSTAPEELRILLLGIDNAGKVTLQRLSELREDGIFIV